MNVVEFLASLSKLDIRLWLEGENLRFSAPEGAFTADIRDKVVSNKPAIIEFLRQARKLNETAIEPVSRSLPLLTSFGQQRLWILDQLNPRDVTYNMSSALRIRGALNVAVLEKVLRELVKRHESLRTRFDDNDGEPVQVILPPESWHFRRTDLSELPEAEQQAKIAQAVNDESLTPYDLKAGSLFRAHLIQLQQDHHVLVAGMHHIISDAWSMEVLVKELSILYMAFSAGMSSPLPPLTIQYADYSAWQRQQMESDEMQKHLDYWQQTLNGAPPVLAIPTDRPRQDIPTNNGALKVVPLNDALAGKINHACSSLDVTPFMFFLGAWQLLLGRYAISQDVVIGSPIAGRSRSEVQELIGFFVNLLLMRLDLSGNPTVEEFYRRVKDMSLGAFSHQDLPIDRLLEAMEVERQPGYPPLAQAAFQLINMQDADGANPFGDAPVQIEPIPSSHVAARMDMVLGIAKTGDHYEASLEFNTDLFDDHTVSGMLDQYLFLLDALAGSQSTCIDDIELYDSVHLLDQLGYSAEDNDLLSLNSNQRSMLLDQLAHPETIQNAYGIYADLPGKPDLDVLHRAIQLVVDAAPVLRMKITECNIPAADMAYAVIPRKSAANLQIVDLSSQHWDGFSIHDAAMKLMHRTYDVYQDDLVSYYLLHKEESFRLVVACHHIVLDGASTYLLMERLVDTYKSILMGEAVALQTDVGAEAFLRWSKQHSDHPQVLDFWRQKATLVEPLNFSFSSRYRDPGRETRFNDCVDSITLDHRQVATIREYCAANKVNLPLYFKALFGLMIQHYCRPDAGFSFAEFYSCRQDVWDRDLGCFYQQFPSIVPAALNGRGVTVHDWLTSLKESRDSARSFRAISLQAQQQILPVGRTVFMFNYYNFVNNLTLDQASVQPVMSAPKVDGGVQFIVKEQTQGIELELRYDANTFNGLRFLERTIHLNEQIQFEDLASVADLQFLSSAEQIAQLANVLQRDIEPQDNVVVRFESIVEKYPDNEAVISAVETLTYKQLNERSNQLAHALIDMGVGANVRVGVCLDRSANLLVAIFGVLKAGGAYVPLDPSYPRERLSFMVKDSAAPVVVTVSEHADCLGSIDGHVLCLDAEDSGLSGMSAVNPKVLIDPSQQIYVIYTSGSTGQPKGAMVCHGGEVNLQSWYLESLDITNQDRTLMVSAVGFDLSQKNLFAPLMVGAGLVMPSMELYDEHELLGLINQHAITWVNCAPSAFYPIVELAAVDGYKALKSLRFLVLGGEAIRLGPLYPWLTSAHSQAQLINSYGPTECTDVVAFHVLDVIENDQQSIPIGKPVPNTQLFILNDNLQQVVPGCVGEICIAGAGVGLGYINRDDLTEAVFVESSLTLGKLYRTGDLGRLLPTGDIEYIGRKDFQVKLRGLRIELGEIEHALKALQGIDDALVVVHQDRLIGYIVAQNEPAGWREMLRDHIPEYMIPSLLISVDRWPLTPNGKVDRKALPDPDAAVADLQVYVAPRNATEQQLVAIWQEVLQRTNIGVQDNLFDVGGNSLLATRIVSRIKKQFQIPLSVRELFVAPTIAELSIAVERANQTRNIPPIERVPSDSVVPLSFAQQRLWFLDQLEPGSTAYNMPGAFRLRGRVDVSALRQALETIVARHDILRTTMQLIDDEPVQVVSAAHTWAFDIIELAHLNHQQQHVRVDSAVDGLYGHVFNLDQGPLFYAKLLVLGEQDYVLLINMHHIVSDGWSNGILMRELGQLYDAYSNGRPSPLPDLKVQYGDFSKWQRNWLSGDELERQVSYWRNALAGVEVLGLPTNHARTTKTGFAGNVLGFQLNSQLSAKLNLLCKQHGVSMYMVTLAAYMVLLSKYTNQRDIAVGSPIANRNFEEIEPVIGFFVNTLVLRGELDLDLSFTDFLGQIRQKTLDAFAHQDVPFERLVDELVSERDMLHSPLFQVLFSLQNIGIDASATIPGISLDSIANNQVVAKFDLEFSLMEQGDVINGEVVYRTELFHKPFVQNLIQHYIKILEQVVEAPQSSIDDISIITPAEIQRLHGWNNTERDYDRDITVHQLIERQVDRTPHAPALIRGDEALTYIELDSKANQLAHYIMQSGVVAGAVVAVMMPRSPELIVTILAILKSGATYLPLDPAYPGERIEYMLQDSQASLLITDTKERLASDVDVNARISLASIEAELVAHADSRPTLQGAADSLLYVIYTSGSTGKPKGTGARHYAEVNLLNWYCREFSMSENDRVLLVSAIGFDLTQKNLFAPLVSGAALVLPMAVEYDPYELLNDIEKHSVSWINCAPNAFYPILDEMVDYKQLDSLRWVFLGGEPIDFDRVSEWLQHGNGQLVNSYGPTECADIATYHIVQNVDLYESGSIPIGAAIDNVKLYIVDEKQRMVPEGVPGELCIGGESVGPGYFNDPVQTADKFVLNVNVAHQPKMYRTGDLARFLPNGEVEYLGRIDNQVKVRGFRIEPGEIESLLRQMDGVKASCVIVREDVQGQKALVAYVVAGRSYSQAEYRDFLKPNLPEFMLPSVVVPLDAMPLTPNGKVAKNMLPAPDVVAVEDRVIVAPTTESESRVLEIWQSILKRDDLSVEDDFFAVGGQSILATQVMSRIRREFNVNLPLRALFEQPTIRNTAQHIDGAISSDDHNVPPIVRIDRDEPLPLSFVQQQLWLLDQLDPGTPAYNMPVALRIRGELNVAAFIESFNAIIQRHETLRTNFDSVDGKPTALIHDVRIWDMAQRDISSLDAIAREAELKRIVHTQMSMGFDLKFDHLMRGELIKVSNGPEVEHAFIGAIHHIVSDGWSLNVMTAELMEFYQAVIDQRSPFLPELDIQYVDVAAWQRNWLTGDTLDTHLNYWRNQLDNDGQVLQLQTDYPRPAVMTSNGGVVKGHIAPRDLAMAQQFAKEEGATLFMVLVATYQLLLHKYTGQQRINIGTPIAGRDTIESERLVGFFINTVVLSTELEGAMSGRSLLRQVKEVTLGAYSHQALPFEKLVEELRPPRDTSRTPFFQVFLNLLNLPPQSDDNAALKIEPLSDDDAHSHAKYDFNLYVSEDGDNGLELVMVYNSDLYRQDTVERFVTDFSRLLGSISAESDKEISNLSLDSRGLPWLPDLDVAPKLEKHASPIDLFLRHANNNPSALAIRENSSDITYGELAKNSLNIASELVQRGAGEGVVIAILATRSSLLIESLLAVLRTGSVFTILDSGYPEDRLTQIVQESEPLLIIDATGQGVDSSKLEQTFGCAVLSVSALAGQGSTKCELFLDNHNPDNASYIAFTSGSTGTPKGIKADFQPLSHFVQWYVNEYSISSADRVSMMSGLAHDPLLRDVFVPLSVGASICIPEPDWMLKPEDLFSWFDSNAVTITHVTPSMLRLLLDTASEEQELNHLRFVGVGGDRLSCKIVDEIRAIAPNTLVAGFYGATETPQVMAVFNVPSEITGLPEFLPLGQGIDDVELLVLDTHGHLCAPGQVGELVVRTPYLSQGYINSDSSPFTLNKRTHCDHDRLYHTGDKGRYRADGTAEYLGRIDQQVKIRGFRVEPEEVQRCINKALENKTASVVLASRDPRGDECLVAYVKTQKTDFVTDLRLRLRKQLPEYMVPSLFISVDSIPLNRNGKVDKFALPNPADYWVAKEYVAPRSDYERDIAEIWQSILKIDQISVVDNFFDVGGHSLLAVQIVARVKEKYEIEFSMRRLLEIASIEGMASYVESSLWVRQSESTDDDSGDDFEELEI
ncbi:MAG: amino acid adenylation domain-containing protein [Ketobacter sp.]|nr:amino acid adenylation domain-containing protein [Ketobacter sp.]